MPPKIDVRSGVAISLASVMLAFILLYFSYGFYIDITDREACKDTEIKLKNVSRMILLNQTNYLSSRFGLGEVNSMDEVEARLHEIRSLAGENTDESALIELSMAETSYIILGRLPKDCNLYLNIIKVGQEKTILQFGELLKPLDISRFSSELDFVGDKIVDMEHSRIPKECGFFSDNILMRLREEKFCEAQHYATYDLVKGLEKSLEKSDDKASKVYKAMLINCFAECINQYNCTDSCLRGKIS